MKARLFPELIISVAAILVGVTSSAQAKSPLIAFAIEIGQAKSLPPVDLNYRQGRGGYELKNLIRDTLAILDSNASVLVRMETLRRATIYARQDPQVAKELLSRLHARAANSDAAGYTAALAWFDAGYLTETYKQWFGKGEPNPAIGLDGYAWVKKAIGLRAEDPEMEFAAALITLAGPESEHQEHVRKAMEAAKGDPLLAQNLASNFERRTISELLTNADAGGFQK